MSFLRAIIFPVLILQLFLFCVKGEKKKEKKVYNIDFYFKISDNVTIDDIWCIYFRGFDFENFLEPLTENIILPDDLRERNMKYTWEFEQLFKDEFYAEFSGFSTSATYSLQITSGAKRENICYQMVSIYKTGELREDYYGLSLTVPASVFETEKSYSTKTIFSKRGEFGKMPDLKHTPRKHHIIQGLGKDYLICGGINIAPDNGVVMRNCESFDTRELRFKKVGVMKSERYLASSALLPDGRVLITGGIDAQGKIVEASEIYNPKTVSFTTYSEMLYPRYMHSTFVIGEMVLILGGIGKNGLYEKRAELFDTTKELFLDWKIIEEIPGCYSYFNDKIYMFGGKLERVKTIDPKTKNISDEGINQPINGPCKTHTAKGKVAILSPYGKVVIFNGETYSTVDLPLKLKSAEIFISDNYIIIGGGYDLQNYTISSTNTAIIVYPDSKTTSILNLKEARSGFSMLPLLGFTLIVGGEKYGIPEIFKP